MNRPTDTIFQESWWLDTVAPGSWTPVEYRENGQLRAWLPLVERPRRFGFRHLGMPPLTQTLGPWVQPVDGSRYRQITKIHEFTSALIKQVPACDYFNQNAHYELEDVLPFHWQGYESAVRYTYVLDELSDTDELWNHMAGRPRRAIRKAKKLLRVEEIDEINLFIDLYQDVLETRNWRARRPRSRRGCLSSRPWTEVCAMLCAKDAKGRPHGAIFLLYDHRTTYYLMGGTDLASR